MSPTRRWRHRLDDWLLPFLSGEASLRADRSRRRSHAGLLSLVPHELQRRIASLAPTHFDAPSGSRVPIRYDGERPVLAIRVQELFGLDRHPAIAGGTVPLTLELLSPAHRPIQTTRDLPGFWRGSWADVRSDMRGRYPKHVWPDDPLAASRHQPRQAARQIALGGAAPPAHMIARCRNSRMSDPQASHRLRLNTLIRLRWLAIVGQSAAVLIIAYGFNFPLPVSLCFVLIAAAAWLNVVLALRVSRPRTG